MIPTEPQPPAMGDSIPGPIPVLAPEYRWYHKMSAVLLITFCMEVGFFLVIFPWTEFWDANYFSSLIPEWRRHWDNMYVRGAISGLGVVNLWIAFAEIFRLRRFAKRRS